VHRAGLRGPGSNFETEFNAYLRERLRLCLGVLLMVGTALLVMHAFLAPAISSHYPGYWRHPGTFAHLGGLAGLALMHQSLRRGRWSGRALLGADTLLQVALLATCVLIYVFTYERGNRSLVPCLGLLLVTRAVVVPSRARRTLLGALPAPLAVLAVQIVRGREAFGQPPPMAHEAFVEMVAWDFAYLALCVAVATVASRVNFRLRVSAYEAKRLDQYVLEGLLGKGAMGEVHRARHALMRRPTAIKLVRSDLLTERLLRRFEQEVRQTSRLTHPNTIRVYDYGQTADGVFYYAMELLEGADLERIVQAGGPLPPARAIHVLVQALGALAEAHSIGLVHRDVKPSNLLLCRQGLAHDVVKVMDFGLVRDTSAVEPSLASADEICGSPQTIAPEVVQGQPATPAADLYALGAVGCWLLTGKPIFDAEKVMEFVLAHVQRPPIPPSARGVAVPADLERALMSCLAKNPAERPASAEVLRGMLLACADAGRWTESDAAAWWSGPGASLLAESGVSGTS
jgi:serine/threonine-protein kinase